MSISDTISAKRAPCNSVHRIDTNAALCRQTPAVARDKTGLAGLMGYSADRSGGWRDDSLAVNFISHN